jgi:hypothetical protein
MMVNSALATGDEVLVIKRYIVYEIHCWKNDAGVCFILLDIDFVAPSSILNETSMTPLAYRSKIQDWIKNCWWCQNEQITGE